MTYITTYVVPLVFPRYFFKLEKFYMLRMLHNIKKSLQKSLLCTDSCRNDMKMSTWLSCTIIVNPLCIRGIVVSFMHNQRTVPKHRKHFFWFFGSVHFRFKSSTTTWWASCIIWINDDKIAEWSCRLYNHVPRL